MADMPSPAYKWKSHAKPTSSQEKTKFDRASKTNPVFDRADGINRFLDYGCDLLAVEPDGFWPALEQFFIRRVSNTRNRAGVLIYVSLAEHYARIIPDQGIAEKVPKAEWQAAVDAMIGHMRTGDIAAGFIAAIERCGDVLAVHAPPDGSANELPDRLYVM